MSHSSLAVAQRILEKCRENRDTHVTPMQLIKLVYIAHGYMLGLHSRPLINEGVYAWQYGPVIQSLYQAIRHYRSSSVEHVPGATRDYFDPIEERVLDDVVRIYGSADAYALSAATHQPDTPWTATWQRYGQNAEIPSDMIESFYKWNLSKPSHSSL